MLCKTTNGITTKYVYGLGLIGEEKEGFFKTYHFDYRGSTVAITDECGNITDTFKYDTYGKMTEHIGNSFVILGYNGRDGVVTDRNGLLYMRARYYSPDMRRFINADILHGEISDSASLNRYSYVNGNPVSFVDPFGLLGFWGKIAIGVGAILVGAAVVAATAATGGVAAAFVTAAVTGVKAAVISGAIGATVGAGTSAVKHRISTSSWDGAGEAAINGAVDGFGDGFMTGGITAGAGMTIGALGKASSGLQIGQTQKPQYGKVNVGYGTPNTNGSTVVSIQNNAGKRVFSLDFDAVNAVHVHLPKVFPNKHIPVGSIVSGIYSGLNRGGHSRK